MTRILENPEGVKKADVVVGIPSYNEADSIGFVVENVDEGLTKYFGRRNTAIVNVDGGSTDDTKDVFLGMKTQNPKLFISTPKDSLGNFRPAVSYGDFPFP